MTISRSRLVKLFRNLGDGKLKNWNEAIQLADTEIGLVTPDDAHSILVALSKGMKLHRDSIHPVRVAPIAISLIDRILKSSESSFRTKAGTFGLIGRLGIDWNAHIPAAQRETTIERFKESFKSECETHLSQDATPLDHQALGYCCESSIFFGLSSDELTKLVEDRLVAYHYAFPPLAIVQVAQYLSSHQSKNERVWKCIAERVITGVETFTPQNLEKILLALVNVGFTSSDLIDRVCRSLSNRSSMMRLSDCISTIDSVALLSSGSASNSGLYDFGKAIQRRIVVLVVTSSNRIHISDIHRISSGLGRLMIPTSNPFNSVLATQERPFILSLSQ